VTGLLLHLVADPAIKGSVVTVATVYLIMKRSKLAAANDAGAIPHDVDFYSMKGR
jgi:hypothetical protein